MEKTNKKNIYTIVGVILIVGMIIAGTYAYYTWTSNVEKLVTLNTSKGLEEYIIYNGNDSVFVGDLSSGSTYTDGMSSTFSIAKTETASNVDMETTVTMNVDAIDEEISNSAAFYWAVTSGTPDNVGKHLASGSFTGVSDSETIELLISKELTTTLQEYTIWIWIDEESNPSSDLVGKTLDVSVGVQVDQVYNREPGTTYAVYSADDNSLRFYNTQETITESSNYRGRIATAVYTGFESANYTSASSVPWYSYRESVTSVYVEDLIYPVSTAYWFHEFKNTSYFDVLKIDTSNVTDMSYMFYYAGYDASSFTIEGLNNWNVSNVTSFNNMLNHAGYNSTTFNIGNLSGWDTSKTTNMNFMFRSLGKYASEWKMIGNLSEWNTSNVTNMSNMFAHAGYTADKINIGDLSGWDVSKVTNMGRFVDSFGYNSTVWNIGDLSVWNVESMINMNNMFYDAGRNATTWDIGNLSDWDVMNVTDMSSMFYGAGNKTSVFDIGNIGNWDVSSVTNMSGMFNQTGVNATTFYIGDLSEWDTSSVTDMNYLFNNTASVKATTFDIGNLDNWDTSDVTNMDHMFYYAGASATTFNIGDLSGWNVSNVTNMYRMFGYAGNRATNWSMNLSNWDVDQVTSYDEFNVGVTSKITAPSFG